jgi:hypothetical protein
MAEECEQEHWNEDEDSLVCMTRRPTFSANTMLQVFI